MSKSIKKKVKQVKTLSSSRSSINKYLWLSAFAIIGTPFYLWLRQVPQQVVTISGSCKNLKFQFDRIGRLKTTSTIIRTSGLTGKLENAPEASLNGRRIAASGEIHFQADRSTALPSSLIVSPSGRAGVLMISAYKAMHIIAKDQDTNFTYADIQGDKIGAIIEAQHLTLDGSRYYFENSYTADFMISAENLVGLARLTLVQNATDFGRIIVKMPSKNISMNFIDIEDKPIKINLKECKDLKMVTSKSNLIGTDVDSVDVSLAAWPIDRNQIWSNGNFNLNIVGPVDAASIHENSILKNNAELAIEEPISKQGIFGLACLGLIWLAKATLERVGKQIAEMLVPGSKENNK